LSDVLQGHECIGTEVESTADAKAQEMELECLETDLNNVIVLVGYFIKI